VADLAEAYLHLTPAPDARDMLRALEGRERAIFSNGSTGMLAALVRNSGLEGVLEHAISVDPSPKAYALVEAVTGIQPGETMFISSNGFDVAGAKRFGFQVAWVRRSGAADIEAGEAGPTAIFKAQRLQAEILRADHVVSSLLEVAELR
jgi:2-haloacid dehalogenase